MIFRERFNTFADRYVLIGGTACDLIMQDAGLQFRATKDLDIVLCIETVDVDFANAFWAFIKEGGYRSQETAQGQRRFYRFQNPSDLAYPAMLELFSRLPDALLNNDGSHLTPIVFNDDVSSLSAILLDTGYYAWIQQGKRLIDGLPVVDAAHLIPMKARAWLDLRARRDAGERIDSRVIKKHKNDVFRLFLVIDPDTNLNLPVRIIDDMRFFLDQVIEEDVDLKALGLKTISLDTVIAGLRTLYMTKNG